jgi:hypothetical protein
VVVGVQVVGRGGELRVDRPHVHPGMLRVDVVGAPLTVAADRGNQVRLRLLPRCASALTLTRLEIDLPVTPASGRQHQLRVPFPDGPALVRRACGYLPVDEALTVTTSRAAVSGQRLQVSFLVRNDGREPLTVRAVQAPGLEVLEPGRPVPLPPGGRSVLLQVLLRATECSVVPQDGPGLSLQVEGEGSAAELRPSFEPVAREYRAWRAAACPVS